MKIRTGFVSNSSSSSFAIYGVSIDERFFVATLREKLSLYWENDPRTSDEGVILGLYIESNSNLERRFNNDTETWYIGKDPFYIGDDETGKEFRDRVQVEVDRLFVPLFGTTPCRNLRGNG